MSTAPRRRGPSLGPWIDISDTDGRKKTLYRFAMVAVPGGRRAIDCTGSGDDLAEDFANARLIAAAPDLLATLEKIIEADATSFNINDEIRAAKRTIKKVYGL